MKVAITSQNFKSITGHAGKTRRFIIFERSGSENWSESQRFDLPKNMSFHEFRGEQHPIDNVDVLLTASCGDGFKRKMATRGIKVMTTEEADFYKALNELVF